MDYTQLLAEEPVHATPLLWRPRTTTRISYSAAEGKKSAATQIQNIIAFLASSEWKGKFPTKTDASIISIAQKQTPHKVFERNLRLRQTMARLEPAWEDQATNDLFMYFIGARAAIQEEVVNMTRIANQLKQRIHGRRESLVAMKSREAIELEHIERLLLHVQLMEVPGTAACLIVVQQVEAMTDMADLSEICDQVISLRGLQDGQLGPANNRSTHLVQASGDEGRQNDEFETSANSFANGDENDNSQISNGRPTQERARQHQLGQARRNNGTLAQATAGSPQGVQSCSFLASSSEPSATTRMASVGPDIKPITTLGKRGRGGDSEMMDIGDLRSGKMRRRAVPVQADAPCRDNSSNRQN